MIKYTSGLPIALILGIEIDHLYKVPYDFFTENSGIWIFSCFGFDFENLPGLGQILTSSNTVRTMVLNSTYFYLSDGIDT